MREIKFRIWDNCNNVMLFDLAGEYILFNSHFSEAEKDGFIYQQYTGLKDKNGKEIYEGDILEGFGCQTVGTVLPVVFNLSQAQYMVDCQDGFYDWIHHQADQLEIVGNIYENPELLQSEAG